MVNFGKQNKEIPAFPSNKGENCRQKITGQSAWKKEIMDLKISGSHKLS